MALIARVALILLAVVLAAPADASAKQKGKKKPLAPQVVVASAQGSTSVDGQVLSLIAGCPAGMVAIGGGFDGAAATEPDGELTDINIVTESRRYAAGAWVVTVARQDAGPTAGPVLPLTASVHCLPVRIRQKKKKRKKPSLVSITEVAAQGNPVLPFTQSRASASCPAGRVLVSGGFSTTPAPTLTGAQIDLDFPIVLGSHPVNSSVWIAEGTTFGSKPGAITSYAYCAAGVRAPIFVQVPTPVDGPTGDGAALSPICGKRKVAAGGFRVFPPDGMFFGLLVDSAAAGTQWRTSVANTEDGSAPVTSVAACL